MKSYTLKQTISCAIFIILIKICHASLPAFQQKLDSENVCKEKICKFHLTLRDEMSMAKKVMKGRIWKSGETFSLELKNGSLVQKLGTFYQQHIYKDLENMKIENVTDNVITADGVQRPIITINGVFPGPTLEVIEGSEVSTYTELHTFMYVSF